MFYFVKTPWWLKKLNPGCIWNIRTEERIIYLSFDDGPNELATPFVLDQLAAYRAKATFFCLGKNVAAEPELYKQIIQQGHRVGNHTYDHQNGWKTSDATYFENIRRAAKYIDSDLFRPPYGRMTAFQRKQLRSAAWGYRIVMWNVLSGDFDQKISGDQAALNVLSSAGPGSIVIFHDSVKAFPRLELALPKVLTYFSTRGYRFEAIR